MFTSSINLAQPCAGGLLLSMVSPSPSLAQGPLDVALLAFSITFS
jgi:hypothetical protein